MTRKWTFSASVTLHSIVSVLSVFGVVSVCGQSLPATCPDPASIAPCTCSLNQSTRNGLPEVSCVNFDGGDRSISLGSVFQNLSDYLNGNGESTEFERLMLVNSKATSLNTTLFHGVQFRYLSVYETNLTTVDATTFLDMSDTLVYLLIKGDRLTTIFPALRPLNNLTTLIFNLGLASFKQVPTSALVGLPQLNRVSINAVVNTIAANAFVNLPSLRSIKITNQLERIEAGAFILLNDTDSSSDNTTSEVNIDLSNNRLDEDSFAVGFIQYSPRQHVVLDLTYNSLSYLPEAVFRPFFAANSNNRLLLGSNKFNCGRCDSYWILNGTVAESQLELNCNNNAQHTVWTYDWSECAAGSGAEALLLSTNIRPQVFIALVVIQLVSMLFAHHHCSA